MRQVQLTNHSDANKVIMIENRQLIQFLEVARQHSFRRAAQKLHISQPALSRSIQRLEEMLGVKLFTRSSQKITLTTFGVALLPRATSMIKSVSDVHEVIENLKGLDLGEFRVGFGPVYAELIAARSIGFFSLKYPKVKIQTELGRFTKLLDFLNNGKIDLFIGETSTLTPVRNYRIIPLKKRKAIYCCKSDHPIFKLKSINYTHISGYPFVSCQLPIRLLPHIKKPDETIHTDEYTFAYSNIVCDSFTISKQISLNSNAICLIPEALITSELKRGELRVVDFKHKPFSTQSGIVYLAGRDPSPAMEKYIEMVKELDDQL